MENLKDLKLISGKVSVTYSGKDAVTGDTVMLTDEFSPDPAWTALCLRYLRHNQKVGQYGEGSRKISMEGSVGEYPKVNEQRWSPAQPFNG